MSAQQLVIRDATRHDLPFIERMVLECTHWEGGLGEPPSAELRVSPELAERIAGWGRRGDSALIAEQDGVSIGAAWYRFWGNAERGQGFFNARVPVLMQAVVPAHRRRGVGRRLLDGLIDLALASQLPALSLSVDPRNPALQLYVRSGFMKVDEARGAWTMVLDAPLARLTRR